MKNLPNLLPSFGRNSSPEVEVVQAPDVRQQMRDFKKRWETQLDENYAQMSTEAVALGFIIDSNYGGAHSLFGGMQKARLDLKLML
jgi:hypothetical protein